MVLWSALLIQYLLVVLSVRECFFPIEFRQQYQNQIGVVPLGLNPDGFPCFKSDLFGLQFSLDRDHDFVFSKLRKVFDTRIWDPGDSQYKTAIGEIRPWISHIYGNHFLFAAAFGIQGGPLSTTSIILCIVVVLLFRLLRIVFGIRGMLRFQIGDLNFRSVSSLLQSDQLGALVHDHIDCDHFNFVMDFGLSQFSFCWIDRSTLHLGLVKYLRQCLIGIAQIWSLKNGLAAFRWSLLIWLIGSNRRPEQLRNLIRLFRREFWPQPKNTCVSFLPSLSDVHSLLTGTCLFQSHLHFSNLRNGDPIRIWDLGVNDGDSVVCLMELWLFKFRFCWSAMARLHLVLVEHWQPYLSDFVLICWLENILAMFRRKSVDRRGSNVWKAMETFFVFMLKGITESRFLRKTLVRKCWCHYVYLSELALDTSALSLRFVKRSHSHKLLFTIRNKEKSNMKLDNNRFFDRLASKATLRKASSNSLLLYFLLVYGTYICVCNNCASIILYVSVITFLNE